MRAHETMVEQMLSAPAHYHNLPTAKLVRDGLHFVVLQVVQHWGENVPGVFELVLANEQAVITAHDIQDQAFVCVGQIISLIRDTDTSTSVWSVKECTKIKMNGNACTKSLPL